MQMTASAKRNVLRNNRFNRLRIALELRSQAAQGRFPQLGLGEYLRVADACCKAAANAADGDLDKFVADVEGTGNGDGVVAFEAAMRNELGGSFIDIIIQLLPILLPLIQQCFGG